MVQILEPLYIDIMIPLLRHQFIEEYEEIPQTSCLPYLLGIFFREVK